MAPFCFTAVSYTGGDECVAKKTMKRKRETTCIEDETKRKRQALQNITNVSLPKKPLR